MSQTPAKQNGQVIDSRKLAENDACDQYTRTNPSGVKSFGRDHGSRVLADLLKSVSGKEKTA